MGRTGRLHAKGRERKQRSIASVVDEGQDPLLEDECRAFKADDELRVYWVDRCLAERAAASQARAAARQAAAAALAPPAEDPAPPVEEAPAEDPAPEALAAPAENPAPEALAAPAEDPTAAI